MDRQVIVSESEVLKSLMTADDVVKILSACKASGVTRITFNGLEAEFVTSPAGIPSVVAIEPPAPSSERLAELLRQREVQLRDDQLAELMISDPEAYEKAITQGDIRPDA